MSTTFMQHSWILSPHPNPEAQRHLFCFPYTGGSASLFRPWAVAGLLSPGIEVHAIELPGRGTRQNEPPMTEFTELTDPLSDALLPFAKKDIVLFGHSLGGLMAFEVARQLQQRHNIIPLRKQNLRAFGPPLADHVGPMSYLQVQTMLDAMMPAGLRNYWKTNFLKGLSDEAIDTLVTYFAAVPSALTAAVIEQFGGAVGRIGEDETAFSPRDQRFNLAIASRWTDPAESEKHRQWTRDLWDVMQPFATDAVYVNYLPEDEDDRVKALYGAAKYERLVRLKNTYDPTNFFQLNANIKPTV